MKDIKEIVYQAIREIADTEDAERWAVHNDICYDIAVRAVELALGEEKPSEDLEEEISNYLKECLSLKFPTTDKKQIKADVEYIARHFANWQKEQLMKNVVETEVKGFFNGKGIYIDTDIPIGIDVKEGDKVKVIIVKEDEQ